MPSLQEYLLARAQGYADPGAWFADLKAEHGINARFYPDSVVLNYDQSRKARASLLAGQARALQLDLADFGVLSRAFDRFVNFGETRASLKYNFRDALAFDKIDGSLCILYYHPLHKAWHFRSRTTAFGETVVENAPCTFQELALEACGGFAAMAGANQGLSYVFELVSPYTRIITPYSQTELYFITIYENASNREWLFEPGGTESIKPNEQIDLAERYLQAFAYTRQFVRCKSIPFFRIQDRNELKGRMAGLPAEAEGYVLLNSAGERLKYKNRAYVARHAARDKNNSRLRRALELLESGEELEYLAYFPRERRLLEKLGKAKDALIREINLQYARLSQGEEIEKLPYGEILVQMRKGRSFEEIWSSFGSAKKLLFLKPEE